MPKLKQLEQCKHPNSRKTKALAKTMKRQSMKEKIKTATYIKQNLLGEKLLWFRDHLDPNLSCLTSTIVAQLIQEYLGRFNEELEQIKLKHSVGQRKNRQHASRQDVINMTLKHEKEEFQTCGIEMPDLLNQSQLTMLKSWNGELRYLQNFKLRRFSVSNLQVDMGNKNR
ncbi:translation machinery-associated protein 16 homolog isoform X1 [Euwallacea fornicatus]|uniref:translation machinery-associated protein 16 homolog isoform X1 n=2 Tax=Euwallacea fornicatus TaxID=995702 RepID=UPI00338FDCB6